MIFPVPMHEKYTDGIFKIAADYTKYDMFSFWNTIKNGSDGILFEYNRYLKKEEYKLIIDESGVKIEYCTEEGKFRAATSLWQLIYLKGTQLPFAEIRDYPQFERRGYMLDICSGRMLTVEATKKLIDVLAMTKYNELQLYMQNQYCYRYEAYPWCMEEGETLNGDDIEELDRYCKERFIDLVPNQNSLGHLHEWFKEDKFRHLAVGDEENMTNTVNFLMPEGEEFINNLYESLLPHFSSEYVNIGLDEASGLGRYQLKEYCDEVGYENAFMNYLNKLHNITTKKYGKKTMFWDDLIINYPHSFNQIPEGSVALEWGYDMIQSQIMGERCRDLKEMGAEFYVVPGNCLWWTFTGRFDCMIFNVRTAAEVGQKHGAKGYLMTDWGDSFINMLYIPLALAAQYAWNVGRKQHGGWLKPEFVRYAEKFCDKFLYKADISIYLERMANYYLLEPARIHNETMCYDVCKMELGQSAKGDIFDLNEYYDKEFYFDNIVDYMTKIRKDVEKIDFDETIKREVLINCDLTLFGANIAKIKSGNRDVNLIEHLIAEAQRLCDEHYDLWIKSFFKTGCERFENELMKRKEELSCLLKEIKDAK